MPSLTLRCKRSKSLKSSITFAKRLRLSKKREFENSPPLSAEGDKLKISLTYPLFNFPNPNYINILSFPLGLNRAVYSSNKLNLGIGFSIVPGVKLNSTGQAFKTINNEVTDLKKLTNPIQLTFSSEVNLSIEYKLNKNSRVLLQPAFSFHLAKLRFGNEMNIPFRPAVLNMSIGFIRNIN